VRPCSTNTFERDSSAALTSNDVAGLDARQEGVLLRLVEAVDLVDEDDRPPAGSPAPVLGGGHHLFDFLDTRQHGAERHEARLRELGDHPGQRGLAGARRPPEDDRLQHVALDGETQGRAGREDVLLADDVVERAGPHPLGQRRATRLPVGLWREAFVFRVAEETAHRRCRLAA
jgi:hypothetical protein